MLFRSPDAPIYTSQYREQGIDWFKDATIHTGWLNFFPAGLRKILGPLRQTYFSHLDLSSYDLVISVTGAEAKSVKTHRTRTCTECTSSKAYHLCYCHVPTQYYWHLYDQYLENPGFGLLNPIVRFFLKLFVRPLRRADFRAAERPDQFVTISRYAAAQIKQYYQDRKSTRLKSSIRPSISKSFPPTFPPHQRSFPPSFPLNPTVYPPKHATFPQLFHSQRFLVMKSPNPLLSLAAKPLGSASISPLLPASLPISPSSSLGMVPNMTD